ncbi:MAG TPA: 3,4-dihydroxy-2-butanone-4-phosphate synthase [Polyangia bacterium]
MSDRSHVTVEKALADIRAGRQVIVVDDESRENEGDLTMAADLVTPEAINFMASQGRGLICMALSEERVAELRLPMMTQDNRSPHNTAFTVSVDARHGVSTGISARERAHTIRTAVAVGTTPDDLVMPGHVFPLRAKRGGVLVRTGHTEASVDLARMAGCSPAGVICEIMRPDGEMARMPDLETFAAEHGLGIVHIADLVQYRLAREVLVNRVSETTLRPTGAGLSASYRACLYEADVADAEYLALVLGDVSSGGPVLVRVQTASLLRDVFTVTQPGEMVQPTEWLRAIEREGRGILLYILPLGCRHLATALDRLSASTAEQERASSRAGHEPDVSHSPLRDIGLGSQVLLQLGVRSIRLLTNYPRRLAALDGYGIQVVDCVPSGPPAKVVPPNEREAK